MRSIKIKSRIAPQTSEYGSACLAMVAEAYGKSITLFQAASLCSVSNDGCSFRQILAGAKELGFHAELADTEADGILPEKLPCIVTADNKYVVLSKLTKQYALLYTPDRGRVKMDRPDFAKFCGPQALFLSPGEHFQKEKKRSSFLFAISLITQNSLGYALLYALILILISLLLLTVQNAISEVTNVIFSDDYQKYSIFAQNLSPEKLKAYVSSGFAVILSFLLVPLILLEMWIVSIFSHFSAKISTQCRKIFTWSSLTLPMDVYQIRSDGYFLNSANEALNLSYFLSKEMVEVIVRPLMAIVFLIIITRIYFPCCLIILASVSVMIISTLLSSRYTNDKGRVLFSEQSRESSLLLNGLKAIRSIRNSGSEYVFFRSYVHQNRESSKTLKKYNRMTRVVANIPSSVSNITKLFLLLIGSYGVINKTLTYGDLILLQGIYCIISDYIRSAVFSGQSILGIRFQLDNLEEICIEAKNTVKDSQEPPDFEAEYSKLKGHIQIRHVTFGYDREAGKVLDDISLDIPAGSNIAIVGSSGSGKTTLKHLICGRHHPWAGEILYDGIPARKVPQLILANSIASVDQQIIMFADTVMNNIKMWDSTQLDADAILAARDADIYEQIILREGGFKSMVSESGENYSGGQRQRIEIARALSMDPSILVMDEATSALDTIVEKQIVEHVRDRGITTIVVAHRLSTIRNCDCIYVLDNGHIVGQGTHEELMKTCGFYKKLVTVE